MIPRALSWAWKFGGACRNGGLSVGEACNEVVPILFVAGFVDPVLEGAIFVDGDFRDVRKKETKVFHNEIFVVKEGTADTTNIVAARSHQLLGWTIVRAAHCFPKKIKLTSGNHIANARNVIKHPPHMLIMQVFFLHSEH